MSTLLQQLAYQYETDKSGIDSTGGVAMVLRQQEHLMEKQMMGEQLKNGRGTGSQLDQYEREQHLNQLQSMSNLLLEMPSPSSPTSPSYAGTRLPELPSPTTKTQNPQNLGDMSLSELFGFGIPRGSLVNAGQKEQGGPTNYDSPAYRNFQQHDNVSNFYSNLSSGEVPSSPSSIHTPASPGTPGSLYSNPYSYSSVNSSPYNSTSTGSTNYKKQFSRSPVGSPCYGRPIRGSTPYSECNSPSMEFPPHVFNCNGSRSDSPADSDNSAGCLDNSVSDIMSNLLLNPGHHCYPNAVMEMENYLQNGRASFELQKLKKYFHNNQQQQQQQQSPRSSANHAHHYHAHGNPRNNNYSNQVYDAQKPCCLGTSKNSTAHIHFSLDKAARFHRNAAADSDANYTWSGVLPQRTQKPIGYSSKVFLGGVPWDITESTLISTFKQFGQIKVEWPGKDQAASQPKGYVYIVFESEKQVKALLSCCTHDFSNGGSYYYKISSKRMKGKDVQVIPWALNDSNYVKSSSQKLDAAKTVFVGALHGMMTATALATIMNDLFDNVIYAGIDTDKHRYPIGSARITFCSKQSFNKAVKAAFIEVKTSKFNKKIQVDPYIEEAPCSSCYVQQGPYFCRDQVCFKYYCHTCWQWAHNNESMSWHKPMSRGLKNNQVIGLTPNVRSGRFSNLM